MAQKSTYDYWRITLYLSKKQDYALIGAAAKLRGLTRSKWLMNHALRLSRKELQAAQAKPAQIPDRDLLRAARQLPIRKEETPKNEGFHQDARQASYE